MDYKAQIAQAISKIIDLDAAELAAMIEVPSDAKMGDFALPCFKLAGRLKKAPPAIAAELAKTMQKPQGIDEINVAGGYLNFFISPAAFIADVLTQSVKTGYGSSDEGQGKKICIDYSSINIAKPFHIGHLPSTALGNALYRIYQYRGYTPVGINHLGDWGTQFGKLCYAYETWGSKAEVESHGIDALLDYYVKFHDEAEKDETLDDFNNGKIGPGRCD